MTGPRVIHAQDPETGEKLPATLGTLAPASADAARRVLEAREGDHHGRSGWQWLRLQNGDLRLVVFPHGDTYESLVNPRSGPGVPV